MILTTVNIEKFNIIFTGHEKVARLLIHNGADFTIRNKRGKVASDLARQKVIPRSKRIFIIFKISLFQYFWTWINGSSMNWSHFLGFIGMARVLQENVAQKGESIYEI